MFEKHGLPAFEGAVWEEEWLLSPELEFSALDSFGLGWANIAKDSNFHCYYQIMYQFHGFYRDVPVLVS